MASDAQKGTANSVKPANDGDSLTSTEDLLSLKDQDPALDAKMHLVNNAIDEIGWTPYHLKLFFLNGFGYSVDSQISLIQSVVAASAFREFGGTGYSHALNIAVYAGLLLGALFWGFSADVIGRRTAFNITLFACSVACIVAGAMPNWGSLAFLVALIGFTTGGNLVLDVTVFLEYLPSKYQWVLTTMACWWGLGQAVTGFIAWGFLVKSSWNCADVASCTRSNNMGWRYVFFTNGALVFVLSLLRVSIVSLRETPKYLLGEGQDAKVVDTLQSIATKYNRPCSLTLEQLQACGQVKTAHAAGRSRWSPSEFMMHVRGMFMTKKIGLSTLLVIASWTMIGLAYPLFYVFLPSYMASRGAVFKLSAFETWRNYALTNISGIPGPIIAGFMCNTRLFGRRYTMTVGALVSSAFLFAYINGIKTAAQDLGISCAIACAINIYYSVLFAYTPEVLPSAHRATGSGIAVAFNRIMGILSSVVASTNSNGGSAPLYVCASLFVALGVLSASFPFEPYGRRSS